MKYITGLTEPAVNSEIWGDFFILNLFYVFSKWSLMIISLKIIVLK